MRLATCSTGKTNLKTRFGSTPTRSALQRSVKRLGVEQGAKQKAMEIKPVLPGLSEHLDDTANAAKETSQTPIPPFCSLNHGHFK